MSNLSFEMSKIVLNGMQNPNSARVYRRQIKEFDHWAKEEDIKRTFNKIAEDPKAYIQSYVDYLIGEGKTASTIHMAVTVCCKAFDVKARDIDKPQRSIDTIVRSRGDKNLRGQRERNDPKNSRLVTFQECVGIRRAELSHLKGEDLREKNGHLYVHVAKGKGGKTQWQRILASDEEVVKSVFKGISPDQRVFSEAEMKNKVDLHGIRREHAQKCYEYYQEKFKTDRDYKMQAEMAMLKYWRAMHRYPTDPNEQRKYSERYQKFRWNVVKGTPYKLRGVSKEIAIKNGQPLVYDRTAIMMVSVFHLAHWRPDVTVTNYLIG